MFHAIIIAYLRYFRHDTFADIFFHDSRQDMPR